jgi:hypothetical protein
LSRRSRPHIEEESKQRAARLAATFRRIRAAFWRKVAHKPPQKSGLLVGIDVAEGLGMSMERAWRSAVVLGVVVVGACGGNSLSGVDAAGGSAMTPLPMTPHPGGGGASKPDGSGGTGAGAMPQPVAGTCSAVCVPSAMFSVTGVAESELFADSFEACRNDECYRAAAFQRSGGNTIRLTGSNVVGSWDATTVDLFYEERPVKLNLTWALKAYSDEFVDGDHYTLTAISPTGARSTLINAQVDYERPPFCSGGTCARAYVSGLVRPAVDTGVGGEGGGAAQGGAGGDGAL